ncbi:MAG: Crp/Fnr family transcriptional regulator [Acidimicrobiales bacterium]
MGLLDALGEPERSHLLAQMRVRRYRRGQTVFNDGAPGDSLHLVRSGRLVVHVGTPSGASVAVRVVHPGELVGELALVHRAHRRTGRVAALEETETLVLGRRDFEELRDRYPKVDRFLVAALAERLVDTTVVANELLRPPEQRIWRRVAVLADAYAPEPIRMSQEDLALVAGTVRQTVNRVLRSGEAAGVVRLGRGLIEVLDRNRLGDLVGD